MPAVIADLKNELGCNVNCYIEDDDPQTVVFAYNRSFDDTAILPVIRLEIGALAAWTPAAEKTITPYAAEQYGRLFKQPCTEILTVLPKRTFWEKVTILHREAYRPENSTVPARYSRHYYDLYCMANSPVKAEAFADLDLLDKVVRFKDKFYRCSWARYDEAKPGTMKLIPSEKNIKVLKDDYEHMFELSIKQYAELKGITEEFKAENQAEWFQQMNSIKARVINIVNAELIYIRNSGASAPLFAYSKRPAENGIRYS